MIKALNKMGIERMYLIRGMRNVMYNIVTVVNNTQLLI